MNLAELWQYRDLLSTLAGRDIKVRYKQTSLGVVWVVLQPLLAAGIFSFIFGMLANMPSHGLPYLMVSYTGTLGWGLFSNVLSRVSQSMVGNSHLINKVFFPRMILPLSTLGSTLLDFAVATVMMAALLLWYHIPVGLPMLVLPLWLAILAAIALGLGLWAAALIVSYRDVGYVLPVATQMLMYLSPVGYMASTVVPVKWQTLYFLNPLAGVLEGMRWSLLGTQMPVLWSVAYSAAVAGLVLVGGAVMFKATERKFADVI
jgi:lipopolysaccharide transport system permease protein